MVILPFFRWFFQSIFFQNSLAVLSSSGSFSSLLFLLNTVTDSSKEKRYFRSNLLSFFFIKHFLFNDELSIYLNEVHILPYGGLHLIELL